MHKSLLILILVATSFAVSGQNDISGLWNTGKQNTKVQIVEEEGIYSGVIYSSDNENAKIGRQLLKNVKSEDGKLKGKLYSIKKDKWVNVVVSENEDVLTLKVKAGMIKRTIEWDRATEDN